MIEQMQNENMYKGETTYENISDRNEFREDGDD